MVVENDGEDAACPSDTADMGKEELPMRLALRRVQIRQFSALHVAPAAASRPPPSSSPPLRRPSSLASSPSRTAFLVYA